MTEQSRPLVASGARLPYGSSDRPQTANLADILERVLDKGIVIAGDIKVNLLDIELLTIKIRLLVASVDKAREMGIDWWENDPMLTTGKSKSGAVRSGGADSESLEDENQRLKERVKELEADDE